MLWGSQHSFVKRANQHLMTVKKTKCLKQKSELRRDEQGNFAVNWTFLLKRINDVSNKRLTISKWKPKEMGPAANFMGFWKLSFVQKWLRWTTGSETHDTGKEK